MTISALQRRNLALLLAVAAVAVSVVTHQPVALLLAVAAVSLALSWTWGLASALAAGLLAYVLLFWPSGIQPDAATNLSVLILSSFGVVLLSLLYGTRAPRVSAQQGAREIVEKLPGLGWSADVQGHIRSLHPASLQYLGITAEQLQSHSEVDDYAWLQFTHPDDQARSSALWHHSVTTGEPLHDEQRVRRHDGTYRWLRHTVVPARDDSGRITGWFGTTADIHDQKVAEESLRRSERELRLLIDTVPAHIWLLDARGEPTYFNRRLVEWLGMEVDGADMPSASRMAATIGKIVHPDDAGSVAEILAHAGRTGQGVSKRFRLRRGDGEFRWILSHLEPLRDENGDALQWYGVNIDIDDEVRTREALRVADDRLARAAKAASLSELAVSIAHELNSPLQAVIANANAYQRWLQASPPNYDRAGEIAQRIIRDANAAAKIIGKIRALFAQDTHVRQSVDLNTIIAGVAELMGDGVRLELSLAPDLPFLSGDSIQLEQVVVNLIGNGVEAMSHLPSSERVLRITSERVGPDKIVMAVQDRGSGIEDTDRVFNAFHTTKPDSKGMGLAICRSIIEAHNGRIAARKLSEGGSVIEVTLPATSDT